MSEAKKQGQIDELEHLQDFTTTVTREQEPVLNVYEALAAVMAKVPAISKSQKNIESGYAARSIDDVIDSLHGLFAEYGLVLLPEVLSAEYAPFTNDKGKLVTDCRLLIRYNFTAADGTFVSMTVAAEGRDWADKATSKAMSMGLKYGLLHAFLIPIDMPDPDRETPIEQPQPDAVPVENPEWEAKAAVLDAVAGDDERAVKAWGKLLADLGYDEVDTAEKADKVIAAAAKI